MHVGESSNNKGLRPNFIIKAVKRNHTPKFALIKCVTNKNVKGFTSDNSKHLESKRFVAKFLRQFYANGKKI